MKSIDEIRRDNLIALELECGSLVELANRLGRSESQVSQWKNGSKHSETGKSRGMRAESARFIETALNKSPGWMDHPHHPTAQPTSRAEQPHAEYVTDIGILRSLLNATDDRGRSMIVNAAKDAFEARAAHIRRAGSNIAEQVLRIKAINDLVDDNPISVTSPLHSYSPKNQ